MRTFFTTLGLSALTLSLLACQSRVQNPPLPVSAANNLRMQGVDTLPIDDSDLSGGFRPQVANRLASELVRTLGEVQVFAAQTQMNPTPLPQSTALTLQGALDFVDRKGMTQPAAMAKASLVNAQGQVVASAETQADGRWQMQAPAPGTYTIRYTLENRYWNLKNYAWDGPTVQAGQSGDAGLTTLTPGSENAKAAWIHDVYLQAMALFARENVPLNWWQRQIQTVWPGRGNYYLSDTVNLTGAEQWDVNGHEVGHAIYHQALNAASRGGQHKIDDCYHDTLALSEGFASFFSAAVHLEKNDPDARFDQYLVPRRAPIRIENVPDDVCAGPANEWRVSAVFWDIYDQHGDGENLSVGLRTIFEALGRNNRPTVRSVTEAQGLIQELIPPSEHAQLAQVFRQNKMLTTP